MESSEVKAIAEAVGKEVGKAVVLAIGAPEPVTDADDAPEGAYFDESTGQVVYTDPIAKGCDEAEAELIKCLPKGIVTYKGRSGSQTVNHTEESLNFLNDFRKNKKSWKTRFNNR